MTNQELDAIRERCEKATKGPWERWHKDMEFIGGTVEFNVGDNCIMTNNGGLSGKGQRNICPVFQDDDAEFIANARTDIPLLLAEIDRLTAERDALLKDALSDDFRDCPTCIHENETEDEYEFKSCKTPLCCGLNWQWRGIERGAGDE